MDLFINKHKLKAVSSSMHQFCPVVRSIFPCEADDEVVEATTVFLYERLTRDVFGRRFAEQMLESLRSFYKFATPPEIEAIVFKIQRKLQDVERATEEHLSSMPPEAKFGQHVANMIRILFSEAGAPYDDPELVRNTVPRFEQAVRRLKDHLLGIKRQSPYLMK